MEGLTGHPYRNAHHGHFEGVDRYYAPFVNMNHTLGFRPKEKRDLAPENNTGVPLVPQVMANQPEPFVWAAAQLVRLGYHEVNLNLGCPSGTVFSRGRGSGFLKYPDRLDAFFEEVFASLERGNVAVSEEPEGYRFAQTGPIPVSVSVKTRLGVKDSGEAEELVKIFNRYPLSEVIVHARVREDFYNGEPDIEAFGSFFEACTHPVSYNGNLFTAEDIRAVSARFPSLKSVMIGRGLLMNPWLAQEYGTGMGGSGGQTGAERLQKLRAFHDAVAAGYLADLGQPGNGLPRMKELWFYMGSLFEDSAKQLKQISKAKNMGEYAAAVGELFTTRQLRP